MCPEMPLSCRVQAVSIATVAFSRDGFYCYKVALNPAAGVKKGLLALGCMLHLSGSAC